MKPIKNKYLKSEFDVENLKKQETLFFFLNN